MHQKCKPVVLWVQIPLGASLFDYDTPFDKQLQKMTVKDQIYIIYENLEYTQMLSRSK